MLTLDEMKQQLKVTLKPKRFAHSLDVMETALSLAEIYREEKQEIMLAGLLHDCAKGMSSEQLLEMCKKNNLNIDDIMCRQPELLHGPVGAVLAEQLYGVKEKRVIDAIRYHTTGRENMSKLEKIIFLADYIEPARNFPGVEDLRKIAFENLDKAVVAASDSTIRFVLSKGVLIHPDTIKARNYILAHTLSIENDKEASDSQ